MTEQFANFSQSSLAAPITALQTSISIATPASGQTFPTQGNFRITVQSFDVTTQIPTSAPEIMLVTAVAGNVFTVQRGAESTNAIAFASGAQVTHGVTAGVMQALSTGGGGGIASINADTTSAQLIVGGTGITVSTTAGTTTVTATGAGSGTVTSVSVVTANGVSGSVATATTTPAITLTLGAITPSSVAASGTVTGSNLSNTNTGDQNITSPNSTLIIGGSPTSTIDINLTNANIWTELQTYKISDSATTTVTTAVTLTHDTSGTPAANYGTQLLFQGQSTTTADRNMAAINAIWTTATDASRASALQFQTLTAAGSLTTQATLNETGKFGLGTATFGTVNILTVAANNTTDNAATVQINSNAVGNKNLILNAFASQTANAFEAQNSSGTAYVKIGPPTLLSTGGASNFFNVTGTLTAANSAQEFGVNFQITSAGTGTTAGQVALNLNMLSGYTGNKGTFGIQLTNACAGTGTGEFAGGAANYGILTSASVVTAGTNVGFQGFAASSSTRNIGMMGVATTASNGATNIGGVAIGLNTGTTPTSIGFYIGMSQTVPTFASCALLVENSGTANPIALFRSSNTTKSSIDSSGNITTQVAGIGFQVKGGSNARIGTGTLSGGTLAVANTSVTASTLVFLTDTTSGALTNVGSLTVTTAAGTGFTVNSTNVLDTSTFNYILIEQL